MTIGIVAGHVAVWGVIVSIVFTVGLIGNALLFKEQTFRGDDGEIPADSPTLLKVLVAATFLVVVALIVVAIVRFEAKADVDLGFLPSWALGYGIALFLNVWDLVVIDWLILLKIRPVPVPQTPYYTTLAPHVRGFFKGLIWSALFSGLAAAVLLFL